MGSNIRINLIDNSRERTAVQMAVSPIAAGVAFEAAEQALDDLSAAVLDITKTAKTGQSINRSDKQSYTVPTTEGDANREMAVRFVCVDDELNQTVVSVPGPDFDLFPFAAQATDTLNWPYANPSAEVAAMVAVIETHGVHPITNAGLSVIRLDKVGRNN